MINKLLESIESYDRVLKYGLWLLCEAKDHL